MDWLLFSWRRLCTSDRPLPRSDNDSGSALRRLDSSQLRGRRRTPRRMRRLLRIQLRMRMRMRRKTHCGSLLCCVLLHHIIHFECGWWIFVWLFWARWIESQMSSSFWFFSVLSKYSLYHRLENSWLGMIKDQHVCEMKLVETSCRDCIGLCKYIWSVS